MLPDATLNASYQAYVGETRRSDKAFTPHPTMVAQCRKRHKKSMALNIFSAPFLLMRGKEIPTQTFSFSVRMRPEQDDRA
ncbi:hypothetical protein CXP54_12300 [Escherichia albertii]|uniref:Mannitol-1-phosphate 5-dehydrogenase n=1 Tax=Escherichia albertii TaxID=208962 RepID=A0ABX5HBZ7_ESCAL|nr:hypothetical protein CXP54_12300 [Escherichia albertii]EAB1452371.1 hypothetical protein [Escherichia albertii]PSY38106.1 hypothetical protein C7B09_23555 [Escherichia albertii]